MSKPTEEHRVENQARLNRIARLIAEHEAVTGDEPCPAELGRLTQNHRELIEAEHAVFAAPIQFVQPSRERRKGRA